MGTYGSFSFILNGRKCIFNVSHDAYLLYKELILELFILDLTVDLQSVFTKLQNKINIIEEDDVNLNIHSFIYYINKPDRIDIVNEFYDECEYLFEVDFDRSKICFYMKGENNDNPIREHNISDLNTITMDQLKNLKTDWEEYRN